MADGLTFACLVSIHGLLLVAIIALASIGTLLIHARTIGADVWILLTFVYVCRTSNVATSFLLLLCSQPINSVWHPQSKHVSQNATERLRTVSSNS